MCLLGEQGPLQASPARLWVCLVNKVMLTSEASHHSGLPDQPKIPFKDRFLVSYRQGDEGRQVSTLHTLRRVLKETLTSSEGDEINTSSHPRWQSRWCGAGLGASRNGFSWTFCSARPGAGLVLGHVCYLTRTQGR